jgi:hypothetical protein
MDALTRIRCLLVQEADDLKMRCKKDIMRSHRPPIPNPQPDPGPLPDPAPIPSPDPTPIPEPLPPPFVAREQIVQDSAAACERHEIGQEPSFSWVKRQGGAGWSLLARFSMKSRASQHILTDGVRLGLVLVVASIMFAACQPRKPTPTVSHEVFDQCPGVSRCR